MKKYSYLIIAGLILVAGFGLIKAQQHPMPHADAEVAFAENLADNGAIGNFEFDGPAPEMAPMRGQGIIKKLKLTPEQEKKFDDLRSQHQKDAIDLRAKVQKNRIEMGKLLKQDNIDEKKIFELTEENSKLQAEMKRSGLKHWFDVYKMLDKEQQVIWANTLAQMGNPKVIKEKIRDRVKNFLMERRGGQGMRPHHGW